MSRFDRADANKDGKISKSEHEAARNRIFTAMDRNKDGAVDRTEVRAFILARLQERRARRMKRIDPNGDGKITEAEFLARAKARFKRLDANKDGALSPEEVGRGFARRGGSRGMRHRMRRHHMRHGGKRFGRGGFGKGRMFRRFDANRDGKVTKAEFDAVGTFMFLRRDLNGDGVIERAEARGFGKGRRGHRGRRHGGRHHR
jgi:Ca2+-binding EF-hand superfamily protein